MAGFGFLMTSRNCRDVSRRRVEASGVFVREVGATRASKQLAVSSGGRELRRTLEANDKMRKWRHCSPCSISILGVSDLKFVPQYG